MASLKKCIENHCKNCAYDPCAPGSWRHQTESCNVKTCALWEVRPITMETMLARRKGKNTADVDALIEGLDDEEEEVAA